MIAVIGSLAMGLSAALLFLVAISLGRTPGGARDAERNSSATPGSASAVSEK